MPISSGCNAGAASTRIMGKPIAEARKPARTTTRVLMVPPAQGAAGKTPRPAEAETANRSPEGAGNRVRPKPDTCLLAEYRKLPIGTWCPAWAGPLWLQPALPLPPEPLPTAYRNFAVRKKINPRTPFGGHLTRGIVPERVGNRRRQCSEIVP